MLTALFLRVSGNFRLFGRGFLRGPAFFAGRFGFRFLRGGGKLRLLFLVAPDVDNALVVKRFENNHGDGQYEDAEHTENLYEYTPMQIKQAITGYGKAEKQQMQNMVKLLLKMDEPARPDDAADALAVAITHANCLHAKEMYRIK